MHQAELTIRYLLRLHNYCDFVDEKSSLAAEHEATIMAPRTTGATEAYTNDTSMTLFQHTEATEDRFLCSFGYFYFFSFFSYGTREKRARGLLLAHVLSVLH